MTVYRDLRIGDAERDTTIDLLGRHFVDGRLTRLEHEERTEAALRARTQSDLDALLADLPDLRAQEWAAARPAMRRPPARWPLPLVLLAFLVVGVALHGGPVVPLVVLVLVVTRLARHRHGTHGWGPGRPPYRP
ncbi:MAG: DUF1707 SHOCT-like domain-containing protein [Motilibacteraceae bacterium]